MGAGLALVCSCWRLALESCRLTAQILVVLFLTAGSLCLNVFRQQRLSLIQAVVVKVALTSFDVFNGCFNMKFCGLHFENVTLLCGKNRTRRILGFCVSGFFVAGVTRIVVLWISEQEDSVTTRQKAYLYHHRVKMFFFFFSYEKKASCFKKCFLLL